MKLTPVMERFILHWGEMGPHWGVNRSVAQVHALLYVTDRPLNAEDICEALGHARSNVSTSIKELQAWRLIRSVPIRGERREHFESLRDPWDMFWRVMDERKRREFDPTLEVLAECLAMAPKGASGKLERERLESLQEFIGTMSTWYDQMRGLPQGVVVKVLKMGARIRKFVSR